MKSINFFALSTSVALFLTGCGGGTSVVNTSELVQGYWAGSITGAPDGATSMNTVIAAGDTAWVSFENGTAVLGIAKIPVSIAATGDAEASANGQGYYYKLGANSRQAITLAGKANSGNTLAGNIQLATSPVANFSLKGNDAFKVKANAADLVASWSGSSANQVVTYTWNIDSNGTISGSTSTGCTYSGLIKPNTGIVAVLDVNVSESCSGTERKLSGIATLNSSKSILSVAYTTAGDAEGGIFQLRKPS